MNAESRLNQRARNLRQGAIRAMFDKANKMTDVISLGIGEPDMHTPEPVCKAGAQALCSGYTHYTPNAGLPVLRQAISDHAFATPGLYQPQEIIVTNGGMGGLSTLMLVILSEGDEVLIQDPQWLNYAAQIRYCGGVPVQVPTTAESGFALKAEDIRKYYHPGKTKALLINSPNNPTGVIIPAEDLAHLAEILRKKEEEYGHVIYLIADEPYRKLVWNGEEVPYVTKFYDDSLVCYSFSKAVSLPGERIGYILVSPTMKNAGDVYAAICGAGRALGFVCAPSLLQFTVAECADETADFSIYRKNREILLRELTRIGYEVIPPDGAFYLFVKALEPDANAFYERGKKQELLLVPSDSFGCPGYVRIAYCVTTEQIERAIPAFEKLYKDYQK